MIPAQVDRRMIMDGFDIGATVTHGVARQMHVTVAGGG